MTAPAYVSTAVSPLAAQVADATGGTYSPSAVGSIALSPTRFVTVQSGLTAEGVRVYATTWQIDPAGKVSADKSGSVLIPDSTNFWQQYIASATQVATGKVVALLRCLGRDRSPGATIAIGIEDGNPIGFHVNSITTHITFLGGDDPVTMTWWGPEHIGMLGTTPVVVSSLHTGQNSTYNGVTTVNVKYLDTTGALASKPPLTVDVPEWSTTVMGVAPVGNALRIYTTADPSPYVGGRLWWHQLLDANGTLGSTTEIPDGPQGWIMFRPAGPDVVLHDLFEQTTVFDLANGGRAAFEKDWYPSGNGEWFAPQTRLAGSNGDLGLAFSPIPHVEEYDPVDYQYTGVRLHTIGRDGVQGDVADSELTSRLRLANWNQGEGNLITLPTPSPFVVVTSQLWDEYRAVVFVFKVDFPPAPASTPVPNIMRDRPGNQRTYFV